MSAAKLLDNDNNGLGMGEELAIFEAETREDGITDLEAIKQETHIEVDPNLDVDHHVLTSMREALKANFLLLELEPESIQESYEALNDYFVKWRDHILKRNYVGRTRGNIGTPTVEGMYNYVEKAGEKHEGYSFGGGGLPGRDFFRTEIFPTVAEMAQTPDELLWVGTDAIEILQMLMVGELSGTTHCTRDHLIISFFRNVQIENEEGDEIFGGRRIAYGYNPGRWDRGHESSEATGMFKHYYERYGKWFVAAVAKHQGWEVDRHYGDGDYTNGKWEIDRKFVPIWESMPEGYQEKAFEIFVLFGAHHGAWEMLRKLPGEVDMFVQKGRAHLLEYYFELLAASKRQMSIDKKDTLIGDPRELFSEFEALHNLGNFREPALEFAKLASQGYDGYGGRSDRVVSFLDPDKLDSHLGYYNIPKILKDLQEAGYSDDEIFEILKLPEKLSWMGTDALDLVQNYNDVESGYPGGVEAFFEYIERIKSSSRCAKHFLTMVKKSCLPTTNLHEYLELGVELVEQLGDSASIYFNLDSSFMTMKPELLQLVADEPEDFREIILDAADLASLYPLNEAGSGEKPKTVIFNSCLEYWGDPNFKSYIRGYMCLISRARESYLKVDPEKDSRGLHDMGYAFARIVEEYQKIKYYYFDDYNDRTSGTLPDAPYEDLIRILTYINLETPRWCIDIQGRFGKFLGDGIHPYIALCMALEIVDPENAEYPDIEGVDTPLIEEKIEEIIKTIVAARGAVSRVLKDDRNQPEHALDQQINDPGWRMERVGELDYAAFEQLQTHLDTMNRLEEDPEIEAAGVKFDRFKKTVEEAMRFSVLQRMMNIGVQTDSLEIKDTPLLHGSNPATQMIITGLSLLLASGSTHMKGLSEGLEPLPMANFDIAALSGPYPGKEQLNALQTNPRIEKVLRENINRVVERVEARIVQDRARMPGLMPVGGKLHTKLPMDGQVFEYITKLFKLEKTPFRLMHADDSLLLPPAVSALEEKFLIHTLEKFGVITSEKPELQVTMAGRWDEEHASVVGAAMLLSTMRAVRYGKDAFKTTHDATGARIMAYDAGVRDRRLGGKPFPFDIREAEGRTDMLGRRHFGDVDTYRILGNLASHHQFDGMFGDIWQYFEKEFMGILSAHGLMGALNESSWIFDNVQEGDSLGSHVGMVNRFTGRWLEGAKQPDLGVVGDVQSLVQRVTQDITDRRERIIIAKPEDYERLLKF